MLKRNSDLRFATPPYLLRAALIGLLVISLVAPMNFVLIRPGTPTPLFPKVLELKDIKSYPVKGQLYLLTILITNPETSVFGAEVLGCWAKGDCVVAPRSTYYTRESTNEKESDEGAKDMEQSQNSAIDAAANYIADEFPNIDIATFNDKSLTISLENTGGPSGGLVFAIGLVELLTPIDILQGRKIAGTGTISADGKVGPIGGVVEKIVGAKSVGAEIIFISTANCSELPAAVDGISVVAVSTLAQALTYLRDDASASPLTNSGEANSGVRSAGIQGCASVGA